MAAAFLAVFGFLWLLLEPAGLFFPDELDWGWPAYVTLVLLSLAVAIWRARPRDEIERALPPSDVTVAVKVGDVLDQKGNVVVGTNDAFDTALEGSIISASSVQGQLLQRVFAGDRDRLEELIEASVGPGQPRPEKTFGKPRRYEIGTVAVIPHGDARYFLPAFTEMSVAPPPHVNSSMERLQIALVRTWEAVNRAGQREPIHLPIIGSHMARLGVSRTLLIQIAVLSFIAASIRHSSSSRLTIWVHPQDAHLVDIAALDDWLRGLCAA